MATDDPTSVLVHAVLEGAFRGRGWQGPTLSGALRGITPAVAFFRPGRGRRCIWDHVLHAAYWKYAVAAIIEKEALRVAEVEPFPRSPSNWPRVPDLAGKAAALAWARDRALLAQMHDRLIAAVDRLDVSRLDERPSPKHKWTLATYLAGIAAHDAYHCGQVQLLKRLARTP